MEKVRAMETVGIRELRQNLSVYLKRVTEEGATFEVTDHGKPVALLSPRKGEDWYQAMVAAGRIRPAKGRLADLPPPIELPPGSMTVSEALQEQREDRI
jgi:prevent-host-death family protein